MPHWTCERCGARLYSASRRLKRHACPVCQGPLASLDEPGPRFGREQRAGERPAQETPPTARSVDGDPA